MIGLHDALHVFNLIAFCLEHAQNCLNSCLLFCWCWAACVRGQPSDHVWMCTLIPQGVRYCGESLGRFTAAFSLDILWRRWSWDFELNPGPLMDVNMYIAIFYTSKSLNVDMCFLLCRVAYLGSVGRNTLPDIAWLPIKFDLELARKWDTSNEWWVTQESLLRYTPCWCATFLIAELLVKPWWLLDSIADYNALWSYVTFVSFLFAQDNSWFRLWPCSKAEAYKLVLQRLGWDCLHPFYRTRNCAINCYWLPSTWSARLNRQRSNEILWSFCVATMASLCPLFKPRTGFAAFVLHLAGLGWENKVALIYGLAPARRKDCHKRTSAKPLNIRVLQLGGVWEA